MKKIGKFLITHLALDFDKAQYSTVAILLAISIWFNDALDFENSFLETQTGFWKFALYFLFYSIAYYGTLLITTLTKNHYSFWKCNNFWLKSVFALTLLSLDSSVPYLRDLIETIFHSDLRYWMFKVIVNLVSVFTVFMPLLIFHFIHEKQTKHVYGLNCIQFDSRPYFIMLLILLPLLLTVSFRPSFALQYPMYKPSSAHHFLGVAEWITVAGYELAYGLDFVTVEFLFRGFMVIGMITILGRTGVLAMAVTYCFFHFTKPVGEAISSVFGGYILGVIAYETKSIWGGIIVHLGMAWSMEIIGFIQKDWL